MVDFIININDKFKATYECYQSIINPIKNKNIEKFKPLYVIKITRYLTK